MIRTLSGKQVGFVTDYACAVHVILLADYYNLDSIATGMPLEIHIYGMAKSIVTFQKLGSGKNMPTV